MAGISSDTPVVDVADQGEKVLLTETIGSVLWFVMDGLWMLNHALPAKAMVLPTLAVNLWVFRFTTRSFSHMAVVAAMNSWLLMNIFWMVGDLDKDPRPLAVARAMFGLGMVLLALAVCKGASRREGLTRVLAHFRRLKT
jgi:hypothetical protein